MQALKAYYMSSFGVRQNIYFCCKDTELNFSMFSTVMGQKGTFAPWEN